MPPVAGTPAWSNLLSHRDEMAGVTLTEMFSVDSMRPKSLNWNLNGLSVDLSRQRLTLATLELLAELAREAGVEGTRRAMFEGELINKTESRAVLHVALRDSSGLTNSDAANQAWTQRQAMAAFAEGVRRGEETGATGRTFNDVVNIGIGGSHLGPMTVTRALEVADAPLRVHYVANVDGYDLASLLRRFDPDRALFLVASKTFTTQETMANADSAKAWLTSALGADAVSMHFAALSTNADAVKTFGISPERMFAFADWVGGRFSLWSSVGLSAMLAVGTVAFDQLLAGAHAMDRHFAEAPLITNLPVLMALTDIWNRSFLGLPARAVLPYDERLRHLPTHLQQLEMESNGKAVTMDGEQITGAAASVVFGMTGTNGQHTFHQLLHQGPALVAVEFIGVAQPGHGFEGHHEKLLANMLAQAEALALGTEAPETPHHACPGNRPSTVILLQQLDPFHLGMLLALYEHKVMVEGTIWGINSFDQFGVELGKRLAGPVLDALKGEGTPVDPATAASVYRIKSWRP